GEGKRPAWEPAMIRIEQALWRGDAQRVADLLPSFIDDFRNEPLLVTPLPSGGHPRQILRATIAQTILRALLVNLPRVGLIIETYELLVAVHDMERAQSQQGPRLPEFHHLFQAGLNAVTECLVASAS